MYGSLSSEARIAHTLKLLGLPITNFCRLSSIPQTKFMQAMSGNGHALSDEVAAKALAFLEKLYDLQVAADQITKDASGKVAHVPLDWSKFEAIADAIVIRQAQQICVETNDHQLDKAAEDALKAARGTETNTAGR